MLNKTFRLEVKSVDEQTGQFEGYASVFGNTDSDGEVVDKGAFKRTLDHSKGVVPILWQHDRTKPVGWNIEASEDGHGLRVKGSLMLDTEAGRYAHSFLKSGLDVGGRPGLSIGFVVPQGGDYLKSGVRHFKEIALKEYSIVTFPANDAASVTGAKGDAKTKRVDGMDLTADCFAYVGDPDKTETWKLPIKFPGDEEKTKNHIRNALARFSQTQGIPESDRDAVLAKIKRAAKKYGIDAGDGKGEKDFNDSLAEQQRMSALCEERWDMERALSDAIQDALGDDSLSADEKKQQIADSYNQYAAAMADWYSRFIDADTDDDAEEDDDEMMDGKEGRTISMATRRALDKAHAHLMDSNNYAKMAGESRQKAIGVIRDLSEDRYLANDVNKPNPVGGGKGSDPEDLHSLLEVTRTAKDAFRQ